MNARADSRVALLAILAWPVVACGSADSQAEQTGRVAQPLVPGVYQLVNKYSGKCLEVADEATTNGADVRQTTCTVSDAQKWQFVSRPDGSYRLVAQHSGKCLRAKGNVAGAGSNLQQGRCIYRRSKWIVDELGEEIRLQSHKTGLCADLSALSTADGITFWQHDCDGRDSERFLLLSPETCPEGHPRQCGMLAAHNEVRASAPDAETPLTPMIWDPDLAAVAQSWADTCPDGHNPDRIVNDQTAGENMYMTSATTPAEPTAVVSFWASEGVNYDISNNYCGDALHSVDNFNCGHYTQLVWSTSDRVGCGMQLGCAGQWAQIWVCNYLAAGNIYHPPDPVIDPPYVYGGPTQQ